MQFPKIKLKGQNYAFLKDGNSTELIRVRVMSKTQTIHPEGKSDRTVVVRDCDTGLVFKGDMDWLLDGWERHDELVTKKKKAEQKRKELSDAQDQARLDMAKRLVDAGFSVKWRRGYAGKPPELDGYGDYLEVRVDPYPKELK